MKEAYYFSHDANARHDDKILELRAEFGWEGYGLFWALIETLRDCSNYSFPSNAKAGLALSLSIDKTKLETFISKCLDLRLLSEEDGSFFSESLMKRMGQIDEKRRKRAEAGRIGGIAKANAKQKGSKAKAKASKESKEKESKEKEITPEGKLTFKEVFDGIRTQYPGTKLGLDDEWGNFQKKYKDQISSEFLKLIHKGIENKKRHHRHLESINAPFIPQWPNFSTYINQRRWNEEYPEVKAPAERKYPAGAIQSGPLAGMVM